MSIEPLQQAIASTRQVIAQAADADLSAPTPCESWNVGELVNHIIGGQYFFQAGIAGTPPQGMDTDWSAGDWVGAYDEATAKTVELFSGEGVMETEYQLPFGKMPGAAFAGLATTDTFQHGWDLAKATGQSTDLDPSLAAGLLQQSRMAIQDNFRGPEGAPFGAEKTCADDASSADQLAAFLGRDV